jgi:hypothetical protein
MSKLIKICKIGYVLFALSTFGDFILSILINSTDHEANILVHTGGPQKYIPLFFYRLALVLFYYLFTVFVEKWCKKNDVE